MAKYGVEYAVDIVFCIDATGSMSNIIQSTKDNALSFYKNLQYALEKADKHVSQIRVKVIVFRDLYVDRTMAFAQSRFFELPEEEREYSEYVNAIVAKGGGDEPENALEALATAINSDWTFEGDKRRHIVIMYTDASAHPLEMAAPIRDRYKFYPNGMPHSFAELADWWDNPDPDGALTNQSKRMIIYAPAHESWEGVATLGNTIYKESKAGRGLAELDYSEVINQITKSV